MDKRSISGMIKLGVTLAVFAAAACVMLAFVYTGTKKVIDERQQADQEAALKELFPDADSFEEIGEIKSPDAAVAIESAYVALKNNAIIGAALNLSRASYSGQIKTMVGVSADGFITGVKIMEHSDTPGLGANAASPSYFVDSEKHREIYEKVLMSAYPSDFVDSEKRITFYRQFTGKHISHPFRVNHDVIAITASTITSHAVSASVKAAGLAASAWLSGEEVEAVSGASEGGEW
jgi:electron transport complex protein RnfG